MNICQTCGVIVKGIGCICYACGNIVTASSASRLGIQQLDRPLELAKKATVTEFERFVSKQIPALSAVSQSVESTSKLKSALSEEIEAELRSLKAAFKTDVTDFWADAKRVEAQAKSHVRDMVEEATPPIAKFVVSEALDNLGLQKISEAPYYTSADLESDLDSELGLDELEEGVRQDEEVENIKWSTRQKSKSKNSFFDADTPDERPANRSSRRFQPAGEAHSEDSAMDSPQRDLEIKIRVPKFLLNKAVVTCLVMAISSGLALSQKMPINEDSVASAIRWCTGKINLPTLNSNISGRWNITTTANNQQVGGDLTIEQSGDSISGVGHDSVGDFRVNGKIDTAGNVQFQKDYFAGKLIPIKYKGTLSDVNNSQMMGGTISAKVTRGGLINRPVASISGDWQAQRIDTSITKSLPGGLEKMYMIGAGALLTVSLGVAFLSYYLFNPNGKINYWEKEKYIPSQFKGKHAKALREFAKPLKAGGVPLGRRCEWKPIWITSPKDLAIPPAMRDVNPHVLIVGTANKGKSRLMASMVTHDILSRDRAVVVIDTEGALTDLTIRFIAAHRQGKQLAQRVILIDPTVKGGVVTYNPLHVDEDDNLHTTAAAIVQGFKAMYAEAPGSQSQQWSQQTANILRNAALLLMATDRTLLDLTRLLQDNDFRDILLDTVIRERVTHPEYDSLIEAWDQYKKLARTDSWITWVEPILNRVGQPLGDPRIRPIFAQSEHQLNLTRVITEKKILLVRIPQGQLDQNANLLGSLLVTGLRRAAGDIRESGKEVTPTALYLDEFDNLIEKDTLANITAEAANTKIGFVGSTKTLQQFPEELKTQLGIKIGTTIAFAVTKKDADTLGPQMFRVDGRKRKHSNFTNFINPINSSPQYELITDEQHLNVDRMVGLEARHFFCYREGLTAGVFKLKAHEFVNPTDQQINRKLIEKMRKASR